MNRTLYIRADADTVMGTGHVMRCLALGQEWKRSVEGPVVFISRMDSRLLQEKVESEGFSVLKVPAVYPDHRDMDFVNSVLSRDDQNAPTWLVMDGYHFDRSFQEQAMVPNRRLMVVDDNAHLPAYCCDLLLNQNIHAKEMKYHGKIRMKRLIGPQYALLRREFGRAHDPRRSSPPTATRILISLGGGDRQNRSADILTALTKLAITDLQIKVLIGPTNPHLTSLATFAAGFPNQIELLPSSNNMADLMQWADAAVTAAGTTTYEMAASGLPFMTVVIADNQERNAVTFAEHGIAPSLGWLDNVSAENLAKSLLAFLHDREQRDRVAVAGRKLVDGRGAERVVEAMKAGAFSLRPVQWEDRDLLLEWANDPHTRKYSFSTGAIAPKEHQQWLRNKLEDQDCRMYMAMNAAAIPMGVVRFDLSGNSARISVNLAPLVRGRGLGGLMIASACDVLWEERPELSVVEALIRENNPVSSAAFAKAGFVTVGPRPQGNIPAIGMNYHFPHPEVV